MAVLKRLAARTQPWRTPEEMENASEIVLFSLTTLWVDEYRVLMISTSFGGMPIDLRMLKGRRWRKCCFAHFSTNSFYCTFIIISVKNMDIFSLHFVSRVSVLLTIRVWQNIEDICTN